jgi:hypothetical protein
LVIRILIILLADMGKTIAATAEMLGCCEQMVLNQRKRFLARRAEGPVIALLDLPRSGRPVTGQQPASGSADDADVRTAIAATPVGIGYALVGDNLAFAQDSLLGDIVDWEALWAELCAANPEDPACEHEPDVEASELDFQARSEMAHLLDTLPPAGPRHPHHLYGS